RPRSVRWPAPRVRWRPPGWRPGSRAAGLRHGAAPARECLRSAGWRRTRPARRWGGGGWRSWESERTGQAQHVLGHVGKDEIGGNRRHLVQARFAELALYVVFGGEAEAPMELQAGVGRFPGCVG